MMDLIRICRIIDILVQTFHQHAYDFGVKDLDLNTIDVFLIFFFSYVQLNTLEIG